MGKKNKDEAPNPSSVLNRDILQRLNFLYQASVYLESISRQCDDESIKPSGSSTMKKAGSPTQFSSALSTLGTPKTRKRHREQHRGRVVQAADIGHGYVRAMRLIGKKTTVKMDPSVKRTLCKGCDTVLIPGLSVTVRIKSSDNHRHLVTVRCLRCNLPRRIPAPPVHKLDSAPHEDISMEIDQSRDGDLALPKSRRRRGPPPRLPPLFEREGHVIFRGNVQIEAKPL
ncbi:Rpr2-domain-containing protein [Multifurca ochricompacta]|uniref:Rpr2-domain-containing protein n=1 Tax=Multifurca ochricompacta TaxID=376703 RepID=A0AAD4QN95_9AGAM|nr:Rpr2-domain-containing protein [Multifurca ochricompacta]